jgi:hypothetical protein
MSNHARLRPGHVPLAGYGRGRRGAIPDAYATAPPAWRRPVKKYKPNVRQQAKRAELAELLEVPS